MKPNRARSGYLEGYFGRLLSWPQRHLLLGEMARQQLDLWVYAPKEDPLHRRRWREPYEKEWMQHFANFCAVAGEHRVEVLAAVSPGLDMRFDEAADLNALCAKYGQLLGAGAGAIGLFFDDLPLSPKQADAAMARAQASLATAVLERLQLPAQKLWFCPTQYCDAFTPDGVAKSTYLQTLAQQLPVPAQVFWTGQTVISPRLNGESLNEISQLFAPRLALWDNFYANDYMPRRLVICPYRQDATPPAELPLLLNPTGMPHTDCLYMQLQGRHLRGEEAGQALADTLKEYGVPPSFAEVVELFALNDAYAASDDADFRRQLDALRTILFGDWSSPLQREWYPVLQGYCQDLHLRIKNASGGDISGALTRLPATLRALVKNGIKGARRGDIK